MTRTTEAVEFAYEAVARYDVQGDDSFNFTAKEDADPQTIALLLPAVQKVETSEEPIDDFADKGGDDGQSEFTLVELLEIRGTRRRDGDHDESLDSFSIDQGVNSAVEDADGLF